MKKLFENWRKHLNEAAYEPDPRLSHNLKTSFSDAELGRTLKEKFEDEAAEMAEQFDVEHSIEVDGDFGRKPPPPDEENPLVIACEDGDRDACEDLEEEQELKRQQLEVDSTWIVVGDQIYADTEEMYQDLRKRAGY
jgi:hypothetical protein